MFGRTRLFVCMEVHVQLSQLINFFRFRNYATNLPVAEQLSAISQALKLWSRETPLDFTYVSFFACNIFVFSETKSEPDFCKRVPFV